MEYIITTKSLSKEYKDTIAVNNVSLNLPKGSIYGLIGKNGAGKTTMLKMISGLIKPTQGSVEYSTDITNSVSFGIGTLIENPGVFPNMTGFENLKAKSLCVGKNYSDSQLNSLLDLVGLTNTGRKKVKSYSLGMKQRLGIALALVGEPKVLVLDEPINGLDPQGIIEIRNIIHKLHEERDITIIVSSHILDELSKIATHFCIIHNGAIILEKNKEEFLQECGDLPIDEYYMKIIGGVI